MKQNKGLSIKKTKLSKNITTVDELIEHYAKVPENIQYSIKWLHSQKSKLKYVVILGMTTNNKLTFAAPGASPQIALKIIEGGKIHVNAVKKYMVRFG